MKSNQMKFYLREGGRLLAGRENIEGEDDGRMAELMKEEERNEVFFFYRNEGKEEEKGKERI